MSPKVQKLIDDLAREFSLDSHRKEQLAARVAEALRPDPKPVIRKEEPINAS